MLNISHTRHDAVDLTLCDAVNYTDKDCGM